MKKVLLVGIMFMLFMGVVSASSKNGDYKGNPIVKIYNNGVEVRPDDVPALIYNGRTVVPISFLKKFGAEVTWNSTNYSVDVKLPELEKPYPTSTPIDTKTLNIKYVKLSKKLKELGDVARKMSEYSYALESHYNKNRAHSTTKAEDDELFYQNQNTVIGLYNKSLEGEKELISELSGIDATNPIYTINNITFASIDLFYKAYDSVMKWKSQLDYAETNISQEAKQAALELAAGDKADYLNYSAQAYDQIIKAVDEADKQYNFAIAAALK